MARDDTRLPAVSYAVPRVSRLTGAQSARRRSCRLSGSTCPARIVDAIADGRALREVLLLVAVTVAANLLTNLALSGFPCAQHKSRLFLEPCGPTALWEVQDAGLRKAGRRKDPPKIAHLLLLRYSIGMGLVRLIWTVQNAAGGLLSMLLSVSLVCGAFYGGGRRLRLLGLCLRTVVFHDNARGCAWKRRIRYLAHHAL